MERALIIREPWISLILDGRKTWEMRSKPTRLRGDIGLIRQGTGQVVGVACLGPGGPRLTRETYGDHFERHAIPEAQLDHVLAHGWVHPWTLEDIRPLPHPVPYRHRSGAVTFVTLGPSEIAQIVRQRPDVSQPAPASAPPPGPPASAGGSRDDPPVFVMRPETAQAYGRPLPEGGFVVLAGSTAMRHGSPKVRRDAPCRDRLIGEGILVPDADPRHYRFSRDHVFNSSSQAAGVVKDGNTSGPSSWKDEETGMTLKNVLDALRGG